MKKLLPVLVLASGCAAIAFWVGAAGTSKSTAHGYHPSSSAAKSVKLVRARGNWSMRGARAFDRFALYSAGDRFEGLPLVAVLRNAAVEQPDEPVRRDDVDFIYGACRSVNGGGCVPPLEIQVWNACERYRGVYDPGPDGFAADSTLTVRGVPAAFFDGETRLELYTADATIVLFGSDRAQVLRAARALRGVNRALPASAPLPRPSAAVNEGRAACQS